MMRILLFGRHGQLGWELQRTLAPLGEIIAVDYPEIDLAQPAGLEQTIRDIRPRVIVNATAYTAVDRAESEPEPALAINGIAPGIMAQAAVEIKAALIHFSTDYVFNGSKGSPYLETDAPDPLNVYGQSKLQGEQAIAQIGGNCLIFRTSWVYSMRRDSFVTKVLQWARQNPSLRIVADQVSNPTWARMLAEITAQVLAAGGKDVMDWLHDRRGLYHLAGDGYASRYQWAEAILRYDPDPREQVVQQMLPASTAEFPAPAQRPLFSALDCLKFAQTFGLRLPDWEDALRLAMEVKA